MRWRSIAAIAIACAAVDDVSAWCLLAFVVAIARANALSEALLTTGLAAVFTVFMLMVGKPLLARFSRYMNDSGGLTSTRLAGLFVALLTAGPTSMYGSSGGQTLTLMAQALLPGGTVPTAG